MHERLRVPGSGSTHGTLSTLRTQHREYLRVRQQRQQLCKLRFADRRAHPRRCHLYVACCARQPRLYGPW